MLLVSIDKTNQGWQLRQPAADGREDITVDGLCWGEMLTTVARCLLVRGFTLPRTPDWLDVPSGPAEIEYTLEIHEIEQGGFWYTIQRGDRFISRLCTDECLDFVARYTLTGRTIYGGFTTYQQWTDRPLNRKWFDLRGGAVALPCYPEV